MIICADDFGLSPDINRATVELAQSGWVTAVSVMAALPELTRNDILPLLELGDKIDLGLHLTLTPELTLKPSRVSSIAPAGRFVSYNKSLLRCVRGLVNAQDVAAEITEQYNLFAEKTGRTPDFIDGHMHVHQLPGVREGLFAFIRTLPKDSRPYVRNTRSSVTEILGSGTSIIKQMFISIPGGVMARKLASEGILTNDGFAGAYDYKLYSRYPDFLRAFTSRLADRPNGLLMAHPGYDAPWRRAERDGLRLVKPSVRVNRFIRPGGAR